jgi:hypothetical protein
MCFRFGSDPRDNFLCSRRPRAEKGSSHSLVGGKSSLQSDIGVRTNQTASTNGTNRLLTTRLADSFRRTTGLLALMLTFSLMAPRNRTIDFKNDSDGDRSEL